MKDKNFDALLEWTERGVSEAMESSRLQLSGHT